MRLGSWGCLCWGEMVNGGSSRGNVVTYGGHGPVNEYITDNGSQVSVRITTMEREETERILVWKNCRY